MENLAHSLSKKSYGGSGFGSASHKSVYDDVFGGPPKFGVPTLAPRFEDYGEIFGGFHSARGLSIPILDLPVVDEAELSFDVRSAWFDYSEVFGGFDDLNYEVSFEDLVRKFDSGYSSSEDAWSPDQSESFSDELDPSACLANADTNYTQFHSSYYKANQRTSGEIPIRVMKVAHLNAASRHASNVGENRACQKQVEPTLQVSSDYDSNIDRVWKFVEGEQFRKSMPVPVTSGSGTQGTDLCNVENSSRSFAQSKPFVTVNDISLRTKPSRVPPPSRPPPSFVVKKGISEKSNPELNDFSKCAFDHVEGSHSPPFYDVEVDVSSSKSASATIRNTLETDVNITMEIAESKRKCEKKSMEKKEIPYCHVKPIDQDNVKSEQQKLRKTSCRSNDSRDNKEQGPHAPEGNGMLPPCEERKEETKVAQEASSFLNGEECRDITGKPTEPRDVTEYKLPHHLSQKSEGVFAWRQATEYFEVVETDLCSEAVAHNKDDYIYVPNRSDEYRQGKRAGTEASDLLDVEASKAAREAHDWDGEKNQVELLQETCMSADNMRQSGATMESSCVKDCPMELNLDTDCNEEEIGRRKMKMGRQTGDMVNLQNETRENVENKVKAQKKHAENEEGLNLRGAGERTNTDDGVMDIHEKKANARRHWKSFEAADYHRISSKDVEQIVKEKPEVGQEKREKNQKQIQEKEENKKNLKKFCDGMDDENMIKEPKEKDYFVDSLKEENSYQATDDKLKSADNEEKDRDERLYSRIEANDRNSKVVLNLVKNEKHIEIAPVEFYEEKLSNACDTRVTDVNLSEIIWEEWDGNTVRLAFDTRYIEETPRAASAPQESMASNDDALNHEVLCGPAELIKWDGDYEISSLNQGTQVSMKGLDLKLFDSVHEEMHATFLPQKLDMGFRNLKATPASISQGEDGDLDTVIKDSDQKQEGKASNFLVEEKSCKSQKDFHLEKLENPTEDVIKSSCSNQLFTDSNESGIGILSSSTEHDIKIAPMTREPQNIRMDNPEGLGEKIISSVKLTVDQENAKTEYKGCQTTVQLTDDKKKMGGASSKMVAEEGITFRAGQSCVSKNAVREEKRANQSHASEERKTELRLQREKEFEKEQLKKLEEEREREREREKDRMAVDSATLGNRARSSAENRERATAEVRCGVASARERLEKDSMEARDKYLAENVSMEARLRAERAAVEKATAEARQRAFAKTMSGKSSFEVQERVERSVSDKFSSSSRIAETRQSSFSELQQISPQGAGTSSMLRYSYSCVTSGVEGESPQRYKARLERYRRTAERAAKALAEKNMRDLLAQKELAERCRIAESLDTEVKRWSNGKEGNLRALLSTLQYILGPDSGWQPIPLTEVITSAAVKKAYRKATLCVHPDKLQQRGASIQQKYICEKVFDLLKEAWNTFTSEER